jgi:hypothetical protein
MIALLAAITTKFNSALVPGTFSEQLYGANVPSIDSAAGSTGATVLAYPYCRYVQVPGKPLQYAFGNVGIENPVIQFDVFHNDSAGALTAIEAVAGVFDPANPYVPLTLTTGKMLSIYRQKEPVCIYEGRDQNDDDVWHAWVRYEISVQVS